MGDSKPLTASKGGVHRLRNRFGLKNKKSTQETEWGHIHINISAPYYFNCSVLLLVIVNLLMCLIYKFNIIIGMYI